MINPTEIVRFKLKDNDKYINTISLYTLLFNISGFKFMLNISLRSKVKVCTLVDDIVFLRICRYVHSVFQSA